MLELLRAHATGGLALLMRRVQDGHLLQPHMPETRLAVLPQEDMQAYEAAAEAFKGIS